MRHLIAVMVTLLAVSSASAQLLLYEGFNYTVGQPLAPGPEQATTVGGNDPITGLPDTSQNVNPMSNTPWSHPNAPANNPANAPVLENGLTYPGLAASTAHGFALPRLTNGNTSRITLPGAPYSVNSTSKDLYFSFLMNVDSIVADPSNFGVNATHQLGEFFAGLTASSNGGMTGANVYATMVRIRREVVDNTQTGKYQLGLHKNNSTVSGTPGNNSIQWASPGLSIDETVLVVGEYQLATSDVFDDVVRLWINPTPGQPAGTPTLEVTSGPDVNTAGASPAQSTVAAFWMRDGAGAPSLSGGVRVGPMFVDEIRVGTTYASVTPAAPAVLVGDYNNDGKVDAGDYAVWRKASEGSGTLLNETASIGTVDSLDYDAWRGNFGSPTSGLGSSVGVPEPAGLLLMLVGLGMACLGMRRDR